MKIFVTKYALTAGIQEMEAEEPDARWPGMASVKGQGFSVSQNFHGNEWHRDRAAAVARAEEMRRAKIASLDKSRKKLESMLFV